MRTGSPPRNSTRTCTPPIHLRGLGPSPITISARHGDGGVPLLQRLDRGPRSGNSPCDLGGWHIRDDDTTSGMVVDNWTNITAGGFLLFESAEDFTPSTSNTPTPSSYQQGTFERTPPRSPPLTTAAGTTRLASRDGSWELCHGVWDYNEPDEMTPNATNLCAGEPLVLLLWTRRLNPDNPDTIASGMSALGWNASTWTRAVLLPLLQLVH